MNVLWLSHLVPYPPKGGVLQRAFHLLRELSARHNVDLIAFNQIDLMSPFYNTKSEALESARRELGAFCRNIEFVPIDCDRHRYGKHLLALKSLAIRDPYTINWLKSNCFASYVKSFIETNDYDLIHFDTISLIPYMKYTAGIPMVLDHHNIESHMLFRRAENEKRWFMQWYFRQEGRRLETVEKRVCPKFDLNIACSEVDRDRLADLTGAYPVEEVPNGVDIGYFKHDPGIQQQPSLIFAGTLSWYPNIEAARFITYHIWPALKDEIPELTVDIVGANPPEDIRHLAEGEERFHVHGFVDDVRPYIDRASVYVCPINDGGGTKLKILDALAMEKAIVAHPIACEGIRVEEGNNILFATTAEEYIEHIKRLLIDKEERIRLGLSGRRLVETAYAYQTIGEQLSTLYEDCAAAAGRAPGRR